MFKLTTKLLAVFGVTTPESFSDSFAEFLGKAKEFFSTDPAKKIEALETALGTSKANIETQTEAFNAAVKRIASLETGLAAIPTEAKIIELATAKGKEAAITAVAGAASGSPVAGAPVKPIESPNAEIESLVKAGKYEDAFKLDKNAQAEFGTSGVYVAFMKNRRSIKIKTKE